MSDTLLGAILAALAATSWATGAIFARIGMQHMGSTTGTFFSLITGFGTNNIMVYFARIYSIPARTFSEFQWYKVCRCCTSNCDSRFDSSVLSNTGTYFSWRANNLNDWSRYRSGSNRLSNGTL